MALSVIGLITSAIFLAVYCCTKEDARDQEAHSVYAPIAKTIWKATSLSLFLRILIPSSDAIAMMIVVPKLVNSEIVQKDIPELYNIALSAFKKELTK